MEFVVQTKLYSYFRLLVLLSLIILQCSKIIKLRLYTYRLITITIAIAITHQPKKTKNNTEYGELLEVLE